MKHKKLFVCRGFRVTMILVLVFLFFSLLLGSCAKKPPVVEEKTKPLTQKEESLGQPDTCRIITFQDEKKNQVMASVSVFNDEELVAMTLPFRYGNRDTPIRCDSVQFDKTRVEYFEIASQRIDTVKQTVLIGLIVDFLGKKPPLKKGDGEVARIYFTLKEGAKFQDFFLDTTLIKPFNTLKLVTPQVTGIVPVFDNKKAMIKGGIPMKPPIEEKAKTE